MDIPAGGVAPAAVSGFARVAPTAEEEARVAATTFDAGVMGTLPSATAEGNTLVGAGGSTEAAFCRKYAQVLPKAHSSRVRASAARKVSAAHAHPASAAGILEMALANIVARGYRLNFFARRAARVRRLSLRRSH